MPSIASKGCQDGSAAAGADDQLRQAVGTQTRAQRRHLALTAGLECRPASNLNRSAGPAVWPCRILSRGEPALRGPEPAAKDFQNNSARCTAASGIPTEYPATKRLRHEPSSVSPRTSLVRQPTCRSGTNSVHRRQTPERPSTAPPQGHQRPAGSDGTKQRRRRSATSYGIEMYRTP